MSKVTDACRIAESFMRIGYEPEGALLLATRRVNGEEIKGMAGVVRRIAEDINTLAARMPNENMAFADKVLTAAVKCRFVLNDVLQ
ncbi:MAG: hypothetical protein RBT11_19010 [Desulfobacterales bacterium]|nr:hypothetical protein [Desulfobacterales bacterium]